jgi:3-deoxy-7-phosphoheptulonate synthase
MLVVMRHDATPEEVQRVVETIEEMGYEARPMPGKQRTAIGLVGNDGRVNADRIQALSGILEIIHVSQPYKQVSWEWRDEPTIVELDNGTRIGGEEIVVMAGPCSVEGEAQIVDVAHRLREAGATVLRAGAFKPRTSPYSFQGMGEAGLKLLDLARRETGLAIVTEALDTDSLAAVVRYADIIQIGARNMQNFSLLRQAGRTGKPILLKRGLAATIKDLLLSAEYVLAEGNGQVILCERGIRGFDTHTRNLLDLTAIPVVKSLSHLPIIADPSHGTGIRTKVIPMARAAVAAGADGIMVEVHPDPERAMSDGAQSLYPDQFDDLMGQVSVIAEAIGRRLVPALPTEPRAVPQLA